MSLLNTDQISSALPVTPYKNKSTITLYLISDDTQGEANQFFNSLDDIKNAFKINYSEVNFGLPIFCKGYYTKDNSVFTLTTAEEQLLEQHKQKKKITKLYGKGGYLYISLPIWNHKTNEHFFSLINR